MKSAVLSWKSLAPLVIGHRGASYDSPENTLAAFKLARDMGADGIEFDAKLSKDQTVVIHHDRTLDRTTDGSGPVSSLCLDELKQLDAGFSFAPSFQGERIPTLIEVVEEVGDKLLLNIELTNYAHPFDKLPEKVIEIVRETKMEERVLLSSFNPAALLRTNKLAPELALGLLVMPQQPALIQAGLRSIIPFDAYHPHIGMLDEPATAAAISQGLVNFWTVNDGDLIRRCVRMGAAGIITDRPDFARDMFRLEQASSR